MSFFSIENMLQNKIIKNIISMNNDTLMYDSQPNIVKHENIYTSLSLKHPRDCQPKIPKKDPFTLCQSNLKTLDDIFDIETAIKSIFTHSEDIDYEIIYPYHKWSCEIYSEKHGYTHFYIIVSLLSEEEESPYYGVEVELTQGKKRVVNYVLNELKERLNIL
jgi:hypothetical protein